MSIKNYSYKYYFNNSKTNHIKINFQTGFSNIEIFEDAVKLKSINKFEAEKGILIKLSDNSFISVKMLSKPLGFVVKKNNFYLLNSRIPPQEKLSSTITLMNVLGGFIIFIGLLFLYPLAKGKLTFLMSLFPITLFLWSFLLFYSAKKIKNGSIEYYFISLSPIILGFVFLIYRFLLSINSQQYNEMKIMMNDSSNNEFLALIIWVVGFASLLFKPTINILKLRKHRIAAKNN